MTPSEEKGYKVGDLFEVIEEDEYSLGSIVKLVKDDGTRCPKFDLVKGSVLNTVYPNDSDFCLGLEDVLHLAREDKDQDTEPTNESGMQKKELTFDSAAIELSKINSNQVGIDLRKAELEKYLTLAMELVGATVSFGGDTDPESLVITEASQLEEGDIIEIVQLGEDQAYFTEGKTYQVRIVEGSDNAVFVQKDDEGDNYHLDDDTTWRFISRP